MEFDNEIIFSIFVAVESLHSFSAFNPSIFTIERFKDDLTKTDISKGCLMASVFSIVLGLIVSVLAKSSLPIIFSILACVSMSSVYLYHAYKED